MAFPTTDVLDDFNRADEGPPPSASWTGKIRTIDSDGLTVNGNQCLSTASSSSAWWNASTFGPDTECFFDVVTRSSATMRLFLRLQSPGGAGIDGYMIISGTDNTVFWYRIDNAVNTQLGAEETGISIAAGDSLGFEAIVDALTAYKKTGGTWASINSRTDSTYNLAGNIGILLSDLDVIDVFGGGSIGGAPAAAAPIIVIQGARW